MAEAEERPGWGHCRWEMGLKPYFFGVDFIFHISGCRFQGIEFADCCGYVYIKRSIMVNFHSSRRPSFLRFNSHPPSK